MHDSTPEPGLPTDSVAPLVRPSGFGQGATAAPRAWGFGTLSAARARTALLVATALLALAMALVLWARTRPGFDPYGWLTWGRQTLSWTLNTNAAPSWKPLPYLLTTPFALAGRFQVQLWMVASVTVALSGLVFAFRIAYRLTGAPRSAAVAAGVFAAVTVLLIQDYSHYVLSAQSDPMIVALCLGAIDCFLSGRPRAAYVLAVLASLGRPEVWPFLGLYFLWAWRARPEMRKLLIAGMLALGLLWFGIPALTSRTPFVAGDNAMGSPRALPGGKVVGTTRRFLELQPLALGVFAALSVGLAAWRRDRVVLALAAGALAWVAVETALALAGFPALPRYMFEASAVEAVVAGVLVGRLLRISEGQTRLPGWIGIPVVVAVVAVLIPTAISRAKLERTDLRIERIRTQHIKSLAGDIRALGGAARLRACGEPLTHLEFQSVLAWSLRINVSRIGYKYERAIASGRPVVLYTPLPHGGWQIRALNQRTVGCRLPAIGA